MIHLPDTSTEQGQREASVMLARLMGDKFDIVTLWLCPVCGGCNSYVWRNCCASPYCDGERPSLPNLYDPANMALAWKTVCWFVDPQNDPMFVWFNEEDRPRYYAGLAWRAWWSKEGVGHFNDTAQRAWLDKILALAIEAGMLEVKHD